MKQEFLDLKGVIFLLQSIRNEIEGHNDERFDDIIRWLQLNSELRIERIGS